MSKNCFLPAVTALVLLACNNSNNRPQHSMPTGTAVKAPREAVMNGDECERLVFQLVASTGTFHSITTQGDSLHMYTPADSLNFFIEEAGDSLISVKLSHDNEVEPGAFFDQTDAFIAIDLQHGKIFDATANVDPPQETGFDRTLFDKVKKCHLSR